jgi:hypothetical protein
MDQAAALSAVSDYRLRPQIPASRGHRAIMANARKVRMNLMESDHKDDRLDALDTAM